MSEQASNDDPRWKNELHLLEQYADEVGGILNQLAEADSGRAKGLQKQLKQRMEILKKQVDLISRDFPNADGEKICRACYMTLEARSLMLSSGMLRRLSDTARRGIPGGVPIPLKILKGVIALITGFAAKQHEKGNAGKGIELLNRSIAIFDAPDARFLKATVLFDLGDKTGAVSELNHILKNFPDDEHYVLARKLKDEIENPPKKGFCFVATAAYGSPMAQEVVLLSRFRDEVLLHSKLGRLFVAFYYWLSPPIAAIIARFGFLRAATRKLFLSPLLQILKSRNAKLKPGL